MADKLQIAILVLVSFLVLIWFILGLLAVLLVPSWINNTTDSVSNNASNNAN